MLVKLDSQNKLTLPDSIIHQLQKPEFFSINFDDNKIISYRDYLELRNFIYPSM